MGGDRDVLRCSNLFVCSVVRGALQSRGNKGVATFGGSRERAFGVVKRVGRVLVCQDVSFRPVVVCGDVLVVEDIERGRLLVCGRVAVAVGAFLYVWKSTKAGILYRRWFVAA